MQYRRFHIPRQAFQDLVAQTPFRPILRLADGSPENLTRAGFLDPSVPSAMFWVDEDKPALGKQAHPCLFALGPQAELAVLRLDTIKIDKKAQEAKKAELGQELIQAGEQITKVGWAQLAEQARQEVTRLSTPSPRFFALLHDGDETLRAFGLSTALLEWLEAASYDFTKAREAELAFAEGREPVKPLPSVLQHWPIIDQCLATLPPDEVQAVELPDKSMHLDSLAGQTSVYHRLVFTGQAFGSLLDYLFERRSYRSCPLQGTNTFDRTNPDPNKHFTPALGWHISPEPFLRLVDPDPDSDRGQLVIRDAWPAFEAQTEDGSEDTKVMNYRATSGRVTVSKVTEVQPDREKGESEVQRQWGVSAELELTKNGYLDLKGRYGRPKFDRLDNEDAVADLAMIPQVCAAVEHAVALALMLVLVQVAPQKKPAHLGRGTTTEVPAAPPSFGAFLAATS